MVPASNFAVENVSRRRRRKFFDSSTRQLDLFPCSQSQMTHTVDAGVYHINIYFWYYFLQGGESAKCILQSCGKIIKTVGGSTKGLHTHLSSKHGVDLRKQSIAHATSDANEPTMQPSAKKMKITSYFVDKQERSLATVLSRMTARDGLPFSHRRRNDFKGGTAQVWDCGAGGAKRPRALPKAALGVGEGGGLTPSCHGGLGV
jgi:hypothetical protein